MVQGQQGAGHPHVGGEEVVPAVIVFGSGSVYELKNSIHQISPQAAIAIASITPSDTGAARLTLFCKRSQVQQLIALTPVLKENKINAGVWLEKEKRKSSKTQHAAQGADAAALQAGVCKYYLVKVVCPFQGSCKFTFYSAAPSSNY